MVLELFHLISFHLHIAFHKKQMTHHDDYNENALWLLIDLIKCFCDLAFGTALCFASRDFTAIYRRSLHALQIPVLPIWVPNPVFNASMHILLIPWSWPNLHPNMKRFKPMPGLWTLLRSWLAVLLASMLVKHQTSVTKIWLNCSIMVTSSTNEGKRQALFFLTAEQTSFDSTRTLESN